MSASLLPGLPPESLPYYPAERPIQYDAGPGFSGIMEMIEPYKSWLIYGALAVGGYFLYKKVLNPAVGRMSAATRSGILSGAERIGSSFRSGTKRSRAGAKQVIGALAGFALFDSVNQFVSKAAPGMPDIAYSAGTVVGLGAVGWLFDKETGKATAIGASMKAVMKMAGKA